MKEIKISVPEQGEIPLVDIKKLHNELLQLPAGLYLELFDLMKEKTSKSEFALNGILSAKYMACHGADCL